MPRFEHNDTDGATGLPLTFENGCHTPLRRVKPERHHPPRHLILDAHAPFRPIGEILPAPPAHFVIPRLRAAAGHHLTG